MGNAGPDCVFVRDVTISDGQVISPDTHFVKTWLVKTGVNGWPAGCKLTNIDGNKMSSSGSIVLGPQKPHKLVEISVPLTAPSRPGKITSKWRLLAPMAFFLDTPFGLPSKSNLPVRVQLRVLLR